MRRQSHAGLGKICILLLPTTLSREVNNMNSIILNQAEKPEALEEKILLALQIARLQTMNSDIIVNLPFASRHPDLGC